MGVVGVRFWGVMSRKNTGGGGNKGFVNEHPVMRIEQTRYVVQKM